LAIALIAGLVGAFTYAYFSDVEETTATFSTGTIDIEVDGQNPWVRTFEDELSDLKPSETGEISFEIHNSGGNPVVVWKHIGDIVTSDGLHPESEDAEDPGGTINHIHTVIDYDLTVGGEVIFDLGNGLSVDDIRSMWMPLGCLNPSQRLTVVQSYHMRNDTTNWAQGDVMDFAIDLYAEQLDRNGPDQLSYKLFLDNKTTADWCFILDGMWGILEWGSPTSLFAQGLQATTNYSLITYIDPWPGTGLQTIASGTSLSDGTLTLSGFAMPAGYSGKIWLVLTNDVSGDHMVGWNPAAYLFEANKVSTP